jgi:type IV pilus assembly protein PilB
MKETPGGKRQVILVMSDPTNLDAITEIEFQTGCRIRPAVATESAITRAIDYYYRSPHAATGEPMEAPRTVGVAAADPDAPMTLVEYQTAGGGAAPDLEGLDTLSAGALLKLLIKLLVRKGVITKAEISAELRKGKS